MSRRWILISAAISAILGAGVCIALAWRGAANWHNTWSAVLGARTTRSLGTIDRALSPQDPRAPMDATIRELWRFSHDAPPGD